MANLSKQDLIQQVILGVRQYGISNVLFRHVIAERLGVNSTDMECLGLLFHKQITTPSELSRHTGLSSGATTAMLDRLERSELIRRQPNPSDRRGTLITIQKEKAASLAPLFTSGRTAQEKLVSNYSEKELVLIADFLTKLVAMLDEEREKLKKIVIKKSRKGVKYNNASS